MATTTESFPIVLEEDSRLRCDKNLREQKLKVELGYNASHAAQLAEEINDQILNKKAARQLRLAFNSPSIAGNLKIIFTCIEPKQRFSLLSPKDKHSFTLLHYYVRWNIPDCD